VSLWGGFLRKPPPEGWTDQREAAVTALLDQLAAATAAGDDEVGLQLIGRLARTEPEVANALYEVLVARHIQYTLGAMLGVEIRVVRIVDLGDLSEPPN
jgi:hypothetical protein